MAQPDPAVDLPVDLVLRVLGIASSTYYGWRARQVAPSRRQLDDAHLLEMIAHASPCNSRHDQATIYGCSTRYRLSAWAVRVGLIALVVEELISPPFLVDALGFELVDVDRRSGPFCELAIE